MTQQTEPVKIKKRYLKAISEGRTTFAYVASLTGHTEAEVRKKYKKYINKLGEKLREEPYQQSLPVYLNVNEPLPGNKTDTDSDALPVTNSNKGRPSVITDEMFEEINNGTLSLKQAAQKAGLSASAISKSYQRKFGITYTQHKKDVVCSKILSGTKDSPTESKPAYIPENILKDIRSCRLTLRDASIKINCPYHTLVNSYYNKYGKEPKEKEEERILKLLHEEDANLNVAATELGYTPYALYDLYKKRYRNEAKTREEFGLIKNSSQDDPGLVAEIDNANKKTSRTFKTYVIPDEALEEIIAGKAFCREIAKRFDCSRTTVLRRLNAYIENKVGEDPNGKLPESICKACASGLVSIENIALSTKGSKTEVLKQVLSYLRTDDGKDLAKKVQTEKGINLEIQLLDSLFLKVFNKKLTLYQLEKKLNRPAAGLTYNYMKWLEMIIRDHRDIQKELEELETKKGAKKD